MKKSTMARGSSLYLFVLLVTLAIVGCGGGTTPTGSASGSGSGGGGGAPGGGGGTTPGGQAFIYAGIPYPTYTNPQLAALGYTPWPYDPVTIQPAALPSPWNTDQAGFHYVKSGGTSTGNGHPANPRGSLPTSLAPGDVVVLDGKITVGSLTRTWSGSSSNPVFMVGTNAATIARTSGEIVLNGAHTIIDSVAFENDAASPSSGIFIFAGSFQVLRNSAINDRAGFRPGFGAMSATGNDHSMFYNNAIGPGGQWDAGGVGDNDFHGIKVFGDDHWIIKNTFTQVQGDGVQISNEGGSANPDSARRIFAGGNQGTQIHQTMLWTKDATDIIFSENSAVDLYDGNNSATNGAFGGQGDYRHLWIIKNYSRLNGEGVKGAGTDTAQSHIYVIGNTIEDQDPDNPPDGGGFNNWAISVRNGGTKNVFYNTLRNVQGTISDIGSNNLRFGNTLDGVSFGDNTNQASADAVFAFFKARYGFDLVIP